MNAHDYFGLVCLLIAIGCAVYITYSTTRGA